MIITDTQSLNLILDDLFPNILYPTTALAKFGTSNSSASIPFAIIIASITFIPTLIWIFALVVTFIIQFFIDWFLFFYKEVEKHKKDKNQDQLNLMVRGFFITTILTSIIALNSSR